jgi:hypothetical protein
LASRLASSLRAQGFGQATRRRDLSGAAQPPRERWAIEAAGRCPSLRLDASTLDLGPDVREHFKQRLAELGLELAR